MKYVPSSRIGRLLLLVLLFIVLLVLLSTLFGGFQKGTKYNGEAAFHHYWRVDARLAGLCSAGSGETPGRAGWTEPRKSSLTCRPRRIGWRGFSRG
jgi:hypothetical protein